MHYFMFIFTVSCSLSFINCACVLYSLCYLAICLSTHYVNKQELNLIELKRIKLLGVSQYNILFPYTALKIDKETSNGSILCLKSGRNVII